MRETMNGYLATYEQLTDKLAAIDRRIEELAASERYSEQVKKLVCFK